MDNGIQGVVVPITVVEVEVEVKDAVIQMMLVHLKKGEISLTSESRMSNVTTMKNMDIMPQNVCTRMMIMSTLLKRQALSVRILFSYWHTMILVVNMMFGTLTLVKAIICMEEKKLLLNSRNEFSET
jgi:hypothetical protein